MLYWRDIPAQRIARAGRRQAKRPLDERFQEAIDQAAMRARLTGTDAYLEEWRRGAPAPCGDDLEAEAEAARLSLEALFPPARLAALVAGHGHAQPSKPEEPS